MSASIIDGAARAADLRARVAGAAADLRARHGLVPGLAVVLVGADPASQVYVGAKAKQTVAAGLASFEHRLSAEVPQSDLLALIDRLNQDERVDGILVQLPLPPSIQSRAVLERIDPAKDVDGFHPLNVGRLASGSDALVPCTPQGCLILAREALGSLAGCEAVVLGRSTIVGRPMAQLLIAADATVTVAHSKSRDLPALCRRADLLVVAVGRPELVRASWVKPGACVIDVGINRVAAPDRGAGKTRLVGDVAFGEVRAVAGAITPVPGGVGPMTIACLLANTLTAACRRRGLPVAAL